MLVNSHSVCVYFLVCIYRGWPGRNGRVAQGVLYLDTFFVYIFDLFIFFLGRRLQHMEVRKLGVQSEL